MGLKLKKLAVWGFISKGIVYALTGLLALFSAFNMGGKKAGKLEIIDYLENKPFGNVLIFILGIGLICYSIWRIFESLNNPEKISNDTKGFLKRIGFFISGCIYGLIGLMSITDALNLISLFKSSGSSTNPLPTGNAGTLIFIVIGAALLGKGIYQFIKVYKGDFLHKFDIKSIPAMAKRKYIKRIGYAGLISRGLVTTIISYFFLTAGLTINGASSNNVKGTAEAFSFIHEQPFGKWLLGIVAFGMVCYGIFMFSTAAYRKFDT
ncbi:DUF1206 domain-containing protein [uncultured Maribacter sp.]|uniref:DUF1206 domain-containing protein n=1 Tax=uncultured Maribacter sp. TaxID=431308 RepID=UPI0030D727BB|tara:strand:+ start:3293 stop:4087 length:795 start_codon:yes stop_codon:yes gene_type:complete